MVLHHPAPDISYLIPVFPCSQTRPLIGPELRLKTQTFFFTALTAQKLWTSMTLGCLVRSLTQTHLAAPLPPSVINMRTAVYTHALSRCLARRRSHERVA